MQKRGGGKTEEWGEREINAQSPMKVTNLRQSWRQNAFISTPPPPPPHTHTHTPPHPTHTYTLDSGNTPFLPPRFVLRQLTSVKMSNSRFCILTVTSSRSSDVTTQGVCTRTYSGMVGRSEVSSLDAATKTEVSAVSGRIRLL